MLNYLQETYYYNHQHQLIKDFVEVIDFNQSLRNQAIQIYLKVRDGWKYDPYLFHTSKNHYQASEIIRRPTGHCLDKAILLITCLRCINIPSRIHLAKVKNHIAVERITQMFGTDELTPHGFVELWIEGKWVACTPAFNKTLCDKLEVDVLEFDGINDSIFQSYDKNGEQFMEYLDDYGTFEDFPYDFAYENLEAHYPLIKELRKNHDVFNLATI